MKPDTSPPATSVPPEPDRLELGAVARVYRTFGRHYRRYWKQLTISLLGLLGGILAAVAAPWPLKLILDHLILRNPFTDGFAPLNGWLARDPLLLLLGLSVAIVLVALAEALFTYINKYWASGTGDRMVADIRERSFAHLQRLSLSLDETARSGRLVYLLTSDAKVMKNLLIDFPQDFLHRITSIVVSSALMLALDWRLALVALSTTPLVFLLTRHFSGGMKEAVRGRREQETEVSSIVAENIQAMALVQAYGREDSERDRFAVNNRESLRFQLRALRLHRTYGRLVTFLVTLSTGGVLYFGGRLALGGEILPGTLIVFLAYMRDVYGSFDKFSELFLSLAKSLVSGERLVELVEQDVVVENRQDAVPAPPFQGRIEFRDVTFAYGRGAPVLQNVSFTVEPGETVALVGPSGAGKSTLIGLMLRFYDPREGSIRIDDQDIRGVTLESLRNQITIVLQEARLFHQSVADNIAFGRRGATREEVVQAARNAEADAFITALPDGYDTVMAEGGDDLSGGQRQRINIARAIIRDAPIVILDEPLTGLDLRTEARLTDAIRRLTRSRTTFIVSHKLSTIVRADKILMLENGRVRVGRHDELLRDSVPYRELWELQMPGRNGVADGRLQTNGKARDGHMAAGNPER